MTGSISNVKSEELSVIPNTNLSNSLAGRAPGATITGNSGLMGASSEIRMRGGFGDPLFVIDGVIRDKEAFDNLEPYEIDQMSFLKDAASASIYGSAAGNGVVLVTTKGGVKNQNLCLIIRDPMLLANLPKNCLRIDGRLLMIWITKML